MLPPNHCFCPPNENCAPPPPPSEDYAPEKLSGSVLLECSSRFETPKILVITPEFVSKNCFFRRFCNKGCLFLWFHPGILEILRIFLGKDRFFFLVFTSDFVKICAVFEMKTRIQEIRAFFDMSIFFVVFTLGFVEFAMNTFVFWSTFSNSKC